MQQMQGCRFDFWVGKIPRSRKWQPAPVFLPGKTCGTWWATTHGITKSQTPLSIHTCSHTHTHTHTHTALSTVQAADHPQKQCSCFVIDSKIYRVIFVTMGKLLNLPGPPSLLSSLQVNWIRFNRKCLSGFKCCDSAHRDGANPKSLTVSVLGELLQICSSTVKSSVTPSQQGSSRIFPHPVVRFSSTCLGRGMTHSLIAGLSSS